MQKLLTLSVLLFVFVITGFSQALPAGAKVLSQSELSFYTNQLDLDQFSKAKPGKGQQPISAVVRIVGDFQTGLSAYGRNTSVIPAGAVIIGAKVIPGSSPQYMSGISFGTDVEPGTFWYQIEDGRRAASLDNGGLAVYQLLVIYDNQIHVFSAEVGYHDIEGVVRPRRLITGGNTVGRNIQLFGNFIGNPTAVIYQPSSGFEWIIPPAAFTHTNQFSVTIDTSQIWGFGSRSGDFIVTLSDGTRVSDSFTVRLQ